MQILLTSVLCIAFHYFQRTLLQFQSNSYLFIITPYLLGEKEAARLNFYQDSALGRICYCICNNKEVFKITGPE